MKLQSAPSSQGGRGAPCRAGTHLALWGWCPPGAAAQAQEQGNSNLSACCPHHPGFLRQLCVRSPGTGGVRASSHHRLRFLFCFFFFPQRDLQQAFPSQGAQMPILGAPGPHPLLQVQRAGLQAVEIVLGDASSGGLHQRACCFARRLTPKEVAQRVYICVCVYMCVCEGLDLD